MPGFSNFENPNAVIIAIVGAVAGARVLAETWLPTPLLASSDRKTFPFGGRRREREVPPAETNDPELLGDVAAGHYGGGEPSAKRTTPSAGEPDWDVDDVDDDGPLPTILVSLRDPFSDPEVHESDTAAERAELGPWPDADRGPTATEPFPHAFDVPRDPFDDLATDGDTSPSASAPRRGSMPWLSLPASSEDLAEGSEGDTTATQWLRPIELGPGESPQGGARDDGETTDVVLADRSMRLTAAITDDSEEPVRNIARWALQRLIDHDEAERRLELAQAAPPESIVTHALYAAAMDAYIAGSATPTIDDLVETYDLNIDLSEHESWSLGAELDHRLAAFANRTLAHAAFPYLYITTTNIKIREESQRHVVTRSAAIAVGVTDNGDREVLTVELGDAQDETRWNLLLLGLRRRGLSGTRLVVSDAQNGLRQAIRMSLPAGVTWQLCRTHYGRQFVGCFPSDERAEAEAQFASVFDSDSYEAITDRWHDLALHVADRFTDVAEAMLNDAPDLLAFTWFPPAHWRRISTTSAADPIGQFIRKQLRLIGVLPNEVAARRVLTAAAADQHARFEESRRFLTGVSSTELDATRAARRTHETGEPLTGVDRRRADRRSGDRRGR